MDPNRADKYRAGNRFRDGAQAPVTLFAAQYGSPRKAGELWQAIALQLGEQGDTVPAQVAGSLNGASEGEGQKVGGMHEMLSLAQAKPRISSKRQWTVWSPSSGCHARASARWPLGNYANRRHDSSHLGLQPCKHSADVYNSRGQTPVQALSAITITNPGFESGLTGWGDRLTAFVGAAIDNTIAHSGKVKHPQWSTVALLSMSVAFL